LPFDQLSQIHAPIEFLRTVADHVPVGIQFLNADGFSIYVNCEYRRMYGGPPPEGYRILKDGLAGSMAILEQIHQAFAGQTVTTPVIWYEPRDAQEVGRGCAIRIKLVPQLDAQGAVRHVIAFHEDVTGSLFMEKELANARTLLSNILDQTSAVIYIKGVDGNYIFANKKYCEIFALRSHQILKHGDYDLFPLAVAEKFRANDEYVLQTKSHLEFEETAIHADGSQHKYFSLKFPLYDCVGQLVGVCGISTDITKHKMLERELHAAKRMEALGLFAGGVTHNFNNVLNIIFLAADLLLLRATPPSEQELRFSLEKIKDAAESSTQLVRQMLAFGQRESSQAKVIDASQSLANVRHIVESAMAADIELKMQVHAPIWPVLVDPVEVEQIVINLCLNSRDAMPKGGSLIVSLRNVDLREPQDVPGNGWILGPPKGECVELSVEDSGAGMSPETLERAFEPFFTTKGNGTGLGLSSVYGTVQAAGGQIFVSSNENRGTSIKIYFPRHTGAVQAVREDKASHLMSVKNQHTILLVDDQTTLMNLSARVLRALGYKVFEAGSAGRALEIWSEHKDQIDLVVADVIMPEVSGVEMVHEMAARPAHQPLKVLYVSGYSTEKLSRHNFEGRDSFFLEKPFTSTQLLHKVREII
jgi:PAS domain S-box-containing protein